MINGLNALVEHIEDTLAVGDSGNTGTPDIAGVARSVGVTEYHVRRMFSSLAGMPVSEYIRRRRMTVAAGDVIRGDDVLTVAVRYGYGSSEAFGRAFRSVHGIVPTQARRDGGPLRSQAHLRFRLTVEGNIPMDARIIHRPTIRLIGPSTRTSSTTENETAQLEKHVGAVPADIYDQLRTLGNTGEDGPSGILTILNDPERDDAVNVEVTFMNGVAVLGEQDVPDDLTTLDVIEVPEGDWVVFRASGPFPDTLEATWASTTTDWFPSNPWQMRPGPCVLTTLDHREDATEVTNEIWFPVEPR